MCGIVGYTGNNSAVTPVIEGLRRLEYRGYDSAGIAIPTKIGQPLFIKKRSGKLKNLEEALGKTPTTSSGIGHTRWATHGGPTDTNAHPHLDNEGNLALIHNGIIENYEQLRSELEKRGHKFKSETDTESVVHLLSEARKENNGDLAAAMRQVCKQLKGSFTLLAIHSDNPTHIVGARRNSPLVVGLGTNENFLASDVAAFISHTKKALELGQDQVVEITPNSVVVTNLDGAVVQGKEFEISWDASAAERGGFSHFMLKEIYEQPKAISDTLIGRLSGLDLKIKFEKIDKIVIIACGTAYNAGLVGKYAIEKWGNIPVDVELASEYRYREPSLNEKTLVIPISQSGETMDTLMALRYAKSKGAKILSVCNTNGSTIARESDSVLYTHAGPEIAVASTKAFATQLVAMYLIGLEIGRKLNTLTKKEIKFICEELSQLPARVEQILETVEPLRETTRKFKSAESILFLGRHVGYPTALEGALKLKELAYMHAEGFAGGELKHGPIALIDKGTPVIAIMPSKDSVLAEKMSSNIQEVKARGAVVIVISEYEFSGADYLIRIPKVTQLMQPVLAVVPLQVIAYEMAVVRGNDVDQPRNLAKSVTVE
ncbi:MAG: glutamine amidotransferase [Actinobacteria bacterium BACL4 MAG-120820-bin23]|jgi:glutamine---fructose-6-phosphate transaminase (isomerizing)|uniref:glutamine--fructose-6-phosphate transaminase (isomerizing) n=1 Tax=Candidatus Nanopelagicus sp. TaxID=2518620 RepID=UPI0007125347|nr:MAG: glutamine amidotransferase [Actinobacteria bacterium BACL4 MAG-121022-bin9]KRO50753.1 MAG: glutamine amidotransferase [Actinobacteria bacterium BACL4 MAG-120820-bin23]KRO51297.1 MAG: glutamine amidotransferase [Actinobacteria bacterium BACL4 MAG-121001-bin59]KRO76909.1 MAG: glutamine amidotransferase [Actinobacteria bacterium BACL4 MAG-120920-bin74]KRO92900.1 MAG: glutamine amidotransferase [Actinobacteria bacterium BACL4 MAG-120507-bin0]